MTKNIIITRTINAPRELVFKAWTEPERIKGWWGPETFTCPVAKVDLREGGHYLYCMRGTAGDFAGKDFWSGGTFKEIVKNELIVCTDSFTDDKGTVVDPTQYGMSPDFPKESEVKITFEDQHGKTKLTIHYAPKTQAAHDAMIKTQMVEGWNSSLDRFEKAIKK